MARKIAFESLKKLCERVLGQELKDDLRIENVKVGAMDVRRVSMCDAVGPIQMLSFDRYCCFEDCKTQEDAKKIFVEKWIDGHIAFMEDHFDPEILHKALCCRGMLAQKYEEAKLNEILLELREQHEDGAKWLKLQEFGKLKPDELHKKLAKMGIVTSDAEESQQ